MGSLCAWMWLYAPLALSPRSPVTDRPRHAEVGAFISQASAVEGSLTRAHRCRLAPRRHASESATTSQPARRSAEAVEAAMRLFGEARAPGSSRIADQRVSGLGQVERDRPLPPTRLEREYASNGSRRRDRPRQDHERGRAARFRRGIVAPCSPKTMPRPPRVVLREAPRTTPWLDLAARRRVDPSAGPSGSDQNSARSAGA